MAPDPQRAPSASLIKLEKPEKLQTILEQDKQDDCLSCRLTGETKSRGIHRLDIDCYAQEHLRSSVLGATAISPASISCSKWKLGS